MSLSNIYNEIYEHPANSWAIKLDYKPLYTASPTVKIVIIGQAPGIKAQVSGIPWDDKSGEKLVEWLGVDFKTFRDQSKISLLPMDFYYPGKGKSGDLPPRKEFAAMWHPKILKEMPEVELTLLIGQYSQRYYLVERAKRNLTETVKSYNEYLPNFFPIVHPSPLNFRWLSKNPWFEEEVIPELQKTIRQIIS